MKGLMVSLIILCLAGTAHGWQVGGSSARTSPEVSGNSFSGSGAQSGIGSQSGSASRSSSDTTRENRFDFPQPASSDAASADRRSSRFDLPPAGSATPSRQQGGSSDQLTHFSNRSQRFQNRSNPTPAVDPPQPNIRFDVVLRSQELESVKRGGTLVAPVEVVDREQRQHDPSVVSAIAFIHADNSGKKTQGRLISPLPLDPGSRSLKFELTAEQLEQLDANAYQFSVPSELRGQFDQVEFSLVNSSFRNAGFASSGVSERNFRQPPVERELASGIRTGQQRLAPVSSRDSSQRDRSVFSAPAPPRNNDIGGFGQNFSRQDLSRGTTNSRERFSGGPLAPIDNSGQLGSRELNDAQQQLRQMRAELAESEQREREALQVGQLWKDRADRSESIIRQDSLREQLSSAVDSGQARLASLTTTPFGSRRSDFAVNSRLNTQLTGRDAQLEQALNEIKNLKRQADQANSEFNELKTIATSYRDRLANATSIPNERDDSFRLPGGSLSLAAGVRRGQGVSDSELPNLGDSPAGKAHKPVAENMGNGDVGPGQLFLFVLLFASMGLNVYLVVLSRSLYVRYSDLAVELREMFATTSI